MSHKVFRASNATLARPPAAGGAHAAVRDGYAAVRDGYAAVRDGYAAVRDGYAAEGVETYYRRRAATYVNPHASLIRLGIARAVREGTFELSHVLDLAAGSGEATRPLREWGATVHAIEPFTRDAYRLACGEDPEPLTFEQIAAGILNDRRYTLVVCSFAMHLLPDSRLPGLITALATVTPALLILSPHKRPILRPTWGFTPAGGFDLADAESRRRCRVTWYARAA